MAQSHVSSERVSAATVGLYRIELTDWGRTIRCGHKEERIASRWLDTWLLNKCTEDGTYNWYQARWNTLGRISQLVNTVIVDKQRPEHTICLVRK